MKQKTQKLCKRVIAMVCAVSMVLGGVLSDMGTMVTQAAAEHTLWLVGDSTVCSFNDSYYYPRYGYGTQIGNYLDGTYEVKNLALSGRSSKSFLDEDNYTTLKNGIQKGDVLVVGFGHNDEKADDANNPNRYTSPTGDYTTEGSFAKCLYDNYVKMAQDKQAEVILCTPIVRRNPGGDKLTDQQKHVTSDGDYAQAIRDLGNDETVGSDITVIDLTELTTTLYEMLGSTGTLDLHAWTSSNPASVDNTHLNIYGAKKVAWLFANAVSESSTDLAAHITLAAGEPTKDVLTPNPDYKELEYNGELKDSENWDDYVIGEGENAVHFKGSAFGMLGGGFSAVNYRIETDDDGNMHIAALNNKSKITATQDGMAMYYYPVEAGKKFTFSAKATVNVVPVDNQAAFGLMARDDMYIDDSNNALTTDYVVAGSLGGNAGANCFYRKSGVLNTSTALSVEKIEADKTYDLKIVYNGEGYECTFGKEATRSGGFDFPLTAVDPETVYIGMFASRTVDVTYSDIYLEIEGETIVDTRGEYYDVKVTADENGSAKANKTSAAAGATVSLTATPNAGYLFKEWEVVSGGVTIENNQFKMPAGAVEVKAVFEKIRTEWDFSKDDTIAGKAIKDDAGNTTGYEGNGICLQGTTGTGTLAGLQIDATKGKFDSRGSISNSGWVQFNKDTVITVPVTGACKVTVKGYSTDYTVDGTPATVAKDAETFTCEGKKKQVVIKATEDTYISLIKVEELVYLEAGAHDFKALTGFEANEVVPSNHIKGMTLTGFNWNGIQHGLGGDANSVMTLSLQHKANITIKTCRYGAGTNLEIEKSSGTVTSVKEAESASDATESLKFTIKEAAAGDLKLTFKGGQAFIHDIYVDYIIEVGPRNIDVWDIGGKLEEDEELYTNNITPDDWIDSDVIKNKLITKEVSFGDLTITPASGDRLYTDVEALKGLNYDEWKNAQQDFEDGYKSAGAFYANGTGGSNRRYLTIANVQAGDKIVAYMGVTQKADSQFFFEGLGGASGQKDTVDAKTDVFGKYEFVAEKTGSYKIWENNLGKPMYFRVMRVPGVAVSGTIDFGEYTGSGHSVKFINQTTKKETQAVLDGNKFTATLAAGYTYTAVLSGATGYGFTTTSKTVVTTDAESVGGKENVALVVEPKSTYTYSGKITGFAANYNISKLSLTMMPPADSNLDEVTAVVDGQLNFTATLEPDVAYTIQIAGVNDYEVKSSTTVEQNSNYQADITVGLKPMYDVSGGFMGLGDANVTALTFTNMDDKYEYTATVSQGGYSVKLRDGVYLAKATVKDYRTQTHVVVAGEAVSRDLMFVSTAEAPAQTLVSDIYVGYPNQQNNYDTVRDAVAACDAMNPASEKQRITVHIAPGTYREQIVLTTPYISFVNDTDDEVLITWYYGIGYQYYSAGDKGFYDPERAYDKYEKHIAEKWGATVFVQPTATGFRADGITFENSFNRYLTDEELEDGVECTNTSIAVDRKYGLDVQSKDATERAAAMVVQADQVEFNSCAFYSSQDTVYGTQSGMHMYFKNCLIEGQTDYIFGEGDAVFDACELRWKGYSANSQGGYITAHRYDGKTTDKGYLFRNCTVSANTKLTVTSGYFGRPWNGNAKVVFLNTRLQNADMIDAKGWTPWSGNDFSVLKDVYYKEYNTTLLNGDAVVTSGRSMPVMTQAEAEAVKVKDYFGSWTPAFYKEEAAEVTFVTKPFVTDNGDLNTPYPGHKLTVGYSLGDANNANDASMIQWYRVKDDKEILVKTSAVQDKTYKIAKEDVESHIKVVVTPITVSGNKGTAESYTVEAVVREGYEDPDAAGGDVELGDGVNIFLAGDSTVKDYSATGINSGGTARDEGSWGEFLQSYFDSEKVTVVNYANGGRSARNFINEGSLQEIADKIGEGDYLFIQFGHNDCSNIEGHLADRYVPLGTPDENGVYPTTPGEKKPTPNELANKNYGATCYTYDCGGTYKWYLKQYIDVAKNVGAIPVLVTPVSRMEYNSAGTIKPHHDSTDATTSTQVTSNNAYVTAVKQLAEEQDVLLVDGFELTKKLFEDAWTAADGKDTYGKQIMFAGDKTHNNKLGGMIEAAVFASAIQNMDLNISYAVKAPSQVMGETTDGKPVFVVNGSSKFTAYDILSDYAEKATYWEGVGQEMFDAIAEKAKELGGSGENPDQYTITIDRQDGTNAVKKVIKVGTALTETDLPSTLTREGYTFKGWFDEDGNAITVPYTPVGSMTIKARWQKIVGEDEYAITIDRLDGSDLVEKVIKVGTELTETDLPSTLTREGYTFQGWVDEDNNAITVPYKPTKSMTIRAKWQENAAENQYVITIDKQNGTKPVEKVIEAGTELNETDLPSTLTREGYTFQGWVDEDGKSITVPYKPIKSMTIKAKWQGIGLHVELAESNKTYVYTGSAIKPAIIVTNNGELLTEGTDYTVKYSNNVKAAQATDGKAPAITVTGKGRFAGKTTQPFTIEKKDLNDKDVVKGDIVVVKNGKAVPVLIYNGMKLGAKDYEFVDKDDAKKKFTESGSIKIQATTNGNYMTEENKPIELKVTVVDKLQKLNIVVDTKTKLIYNGEEQTPDIKVYDKDDKAKTTPLTVNTDYIIVYSGDKKSAGTQKFNVIGMGKYTGSTAKTYKISPLVETDTTKFEITGVESSYSYKSSGVTLDELVVTYKGDKLAGAKTEKLIAGKDYKVSYSGNKKTGTGKYTITFLGNYKGSKAIKNQTFDIVKASFKDLTVAVKAGDKVYSGKANIYKSVPYVLVDGVALKSSEYMVEYSYLDEAGQKVVIAGGNKVDLAEGENSKEITVTVICKDKSNYSGTVTGTYNVVRKGENQTDLSKAKITFMDKNGNNQSKVEYTGKAVCPDSIVIKIGNDTPVTLTSDNWDADANISVEFVNNIEKGKATVIVSAKDGGSYVGSKTATFSVVAQTIRDTVWSNITKTFGL